MSGGVFRRHVDHIRMRSSSIMQPTVSDLSDEAEPTPVSQPLLPTRLSSKASTPVESGVTIPPEKILTTPKTEASKPACSLRKSTRVKSTPNYIKDYI